MDAPTRSSSNNNPPAPNASHTNINPRALSYNGGEGSHRAGIFGGRSDGLLRREHSDGVVFGTSPNARMRTREYQNDLFSAGTTKFLPAQQDEWDTGFGQARAGRREIAAQLMAERKQRREDHTRRRSSSNLSSGTQRAPRMSLPNHGSEHPLFAVPGNAANPFYPRDLNRPLPRRPSLGHLPDRHSRDIVLPRWQPDVEVNECPICHTAFGFFYRKHHCRKCGRVVCANCSPHRITIPRQFIVHAPDGATPSPESPGHTISTVVDVASDDETSRGAADNAERPRTSDYRIDPALGGGQEVRLCNPCVPDPNPLPPPSYYTPSRPSNPFMMPNQMSSSHGHPSRPDSDVSMNSPHTSLNGSHSGRARYDSGDRYNVDASVRPPFSAVTPPEAGSSSDRQHIHQARPPFLPRDLPAVYGSAPDSSAQERFIDGLIQQRRSGHHPHHRQHTSLGGPMPSHSHPPRSQDLDLAAPKPMPQPQLREEDECPICHSALPPKGADGSETAREAHVSECIETHFSSSAPRTSQPHPSVATDAAVAATTMTPSQAGGVSDHHNSGSPAQDRPSLAFFQQRRRTTGMVVYHATEKDCVGEDGGEAECVICFEEFSVGVEMGRLECLCKFHKACIRQWWDTKGPGSCPVHQQQEEA